MRQQLTEIDGKDFQVVIVGGGISGASAAQYLATEGYNVLLVEKGDYASAATSRSGRLLHCGLRYLAPTYSLWEFVKEPKKVLAAMRAAWRSITASTDFLATTPEHARPMTMHSVVYRNSPYSGWQVDIGARLLQAANLNRQSLAYRRTRPETEEKTPFVNWLRDKETIASVVSIKDHQFNWPERICLDAVFEAQRKGATVRNYTRASALVRTTDGRWDVTLEDAANGNAAARVRCDVVLNMAGAWIDEVNHAVEGAPSASRKVLAVKGVHILVQLPQECRGQGIMGTTRSKEGLACVPWGGLHYLGPTETLYDGDLDDVRPDEEDILSIINEVNYMMPGIGITRGDVKQAWAGVRPITYDAAFPKGNRMAFSKLFDLTEEGMPNVFTLTWAAIMFHRSASAEILKAVKSRISPQKSPRRLSFDAKRFSPVPTSEPVVESYPVVSMADLVESARQEQPMSLYDLLFRRMPLGWFTHIPPEAVERAARAVAAPLGWSPERTAEEIEIYQRTVARYHCDDGKQPWHI